jgi:hypothetical protein
MVQEQRESKKEGDRKRKKTVDARGFLLGMSLRQQDVMIVNIIKVQ